MLKITTPPAVTPAALDAAAMVAVLEADATDEPRILDLIRDATRVAERIACRRLWYREYEQVLEGDDGDRLYLQARPIASVVSVFQVGSDPLTEGADDAEHFEIWGDDGFLNRPALWSSCAKWRCRYFGGYWLSSMADPKPAAAPDISIEGRHIRRAIELIVKCSWESDAQDSTVKSDRVGGAAPITTTYRDNLAIPKAAMKVLEALAPIVA